MRRCQIDLVRKRPNSAGLKNTRIYTTPPDLRQPAQHSMGMAVDSIVHPQPFLSKCLSCCFFVVDGSQVWGLACVVLRAKVHQRCLARPSRWRRAGRARSFAWCTLHSLGLRGAFCFFFWFFQPLLRDSCAGELCGACGKFEFFVMGFPRWVEKLSCACDMS